MTEKRFRNEAIAEAFHYMHIVEAWGTGIPRIINRCKEYDLPAPAFEEFGDGFKVTLFRKASNALEKVSNAQKKISNIQGKASNALEKVSNRHGEISNAQEKVSNKFDNYVPFLKAVETTDIFINNIRMVYEHCNVDTPFGQANVTEWLECSKSKATNIMNVLKMIKIIEKVKGFGPGRYRFVDLQD